MAGSRKPKSAGDADRLVRKRGENEPKTNWFTDLSVVKLIRSLIGSGQSSEPEVAETGSDTEPPRTLHVGSRRLLGLVADFNGFELEGSEDEPVYVPEDTNVVVADRRTLSTEEIDAIISENDPNDIFPVGMMIYIPIDHNLQDQISETYGVFRERHRRKSDRYYAIARVDKIEVNADYPNRTRLIVVIEGQQMLSVPIRRALRYRNVPACGVPNVGD